MEEGERYEFVSCGVKRQKTLTFQSKEELLVEKDTLSRMWVLRRILMQMGPVDAMDFLADKLKQSKSNEDFFRAMNK